jgi:hypothetical protein
LLWLPSGVGEFIGEAVGVDQDIAPAVDLLFLNSSVDFPKNCRTKFLQFLFYFLLQFDLVGII